MKFSVFKKLSVKLTAGIILILMMVTICCTPVYVHIVKGAYISQEIRQMNEFYEELAKISFSEIDKNSDKIYSLATTYNYNISISDSNHNDIYGTSRHNDWSQFLDNYSENAVSEYVKTSTVEGIILRKIEVQNGNKYYIFIRRGLRSTDSVFAYTNRNMMIILLVYMLVSGVSLVILVNKIIQPIQQMSKIAERIAQKDYSVRYEGKVKNDEIGLLAKNVNKMADTIEGNIDSLNNYNFLLKEDLNYMTEYENVRKAVVSNITHELKTPLAIISSQIEMMNCTSNDNKKQFYYNSALEEIEKMSSLIRNLLNYSISENEIFAGEVKEINISSLIEKMCLKRKNHIALEGVSFETDIQENCIVRISENHIIHVFNNYISNAINHTVSGGRIIVKLKKIENKIRFSVYNDGLKIEDKNKEDIWIKFFTLNRKPENNSDIHAGLGLFIVKEISVLESTQCGFENLKNGVEFWFDFNCYN